MTKELNCSIHRSINVKSCLSCMILFNAFEQSCVHTDSDLQHQSDRKSLIFSGSRRCVKHESDFSQRIMWLSNTVGICHWAETMAACYCKKKKKDIKNYILSDAVIWNIEEFLIILEWMRWFCWGVFGICVENKNYFKKVKNYLLLWRRFLSANQTWTELKKKNKKNSFHIPTVLDQFNMAIK